MEVRPTGLGDSIGYEGRGKAVSHVAPGIRDASPDPSWHLSFRLKDPTDFLTILTND